MSYQDLLDAIKKNNIVLDEGRLRTVYEFAANAHADQLRQTGEPYITHPLAVAITLTSWKQSQTVLEAALLHDVVEDTDHTLAEIEGLFAKEVAFLVDGVTKIKKVKLRGSTDYAFVENLRKMFVAMAKDVRVVLIKLADRLHNMETLGAVPSEKQKRVAHETLEIYAPLAERLGMGRLKGDLEDLAFPYIYPSEHLWVLDLAASHIERAEKITEDAILLIKERLLGRNIMAQIDGRHKRKYSLYYKLKRPEIDGDIDKVHDLVALRVITSSKSECYSVLGLVHDMWKPVPQIGVSDFIAQPKPNGYQSIHTKVFDNQGHVIEVQIRTKEMHEQAEYGAAAHTFYDQAKKSGADSEKLEKGTAFAVRGSMSWIKELANWQKEVTNPEEFIRNLRLDALSERIYVFSPNGDVFDLPKDATPVDFAFAVHTDLGYHIQGAKVNQRTASLDYLLENGDVVEILKSRNSRLDPSWLVSVKTARARGKIIKSHLTDVE